MADNLPRSSRSQEPSNENNLCLPAVLSFDDGGLDLSASAAIVPQDDLPSRIIRLTFQTTPLPGFASRLPPADYAPSNSRRSAMSTARASPRFRDAARA